MTPTENLACCVRFCARARTASAQKIYLPGSTAPAALLFEASTQFYELKSPRADEYVRSLGKGPEMVEAIEGCLDAAVREWDEREQKRLLKVSTLQAREGGKPLPLCGTPLLFDFADPVHLNRLLFLRASRSLPAGGRVRQVVPRCP
jgi:hypothetical protein